MKVIIADTYCFYIHNSRNTRFPKQFKNYRIIWNMREALLTLWEGNITEVVIPKLGTPGYDFPSFIESMKKMGQIKTEPTIKYYELNIVKK
jgi:hypothetical protein